jgi:hypothetical protein
MHLQLLHFKPVLQTSYDGLEPDQPEVITLCNSFSPCLRCRLFPLQNPMVFWQATLLVALPKSRQALQSLAELLTTIVAAVGALVAIVGAEVVPEVTYMSRIKLSPALQTPQTPRLGTTGCRMIRSL